MNTVDLIMPKLGESIMEATILKWHKKPGDKVEMDEAVLDIATDKVDSEVPSTAIQVENRRLRKLDRRGPGRRAYFPQIPHIGKLFDARN